MHHYIGAYINIVYASVIVMKIIEIVATRCQTLRLECIKFDFGWAPDAAGSLQGSPRSPYLHSKDLLQGEGTEERGWEVSPGSYGPLWMYRGCY